MVLDCDLGQNTSIFYQKKGEVSSPNRALFYAILRIFTAQPILYSYDTYQQHLETARLAQGKLWAIYESSEAVPHHLTVASHGCRAARLLRQYMLTVLLLVSMA